ncbi:MAG TPA: hybrid sensor histidine kinase/response regulator [bacterium]|nr:hybrid sensor histidine kinase/response regulator [bacterium]
MANSEQGSSTGVVAPPTRMLERVLIIDDETNIRSTLGDFMMLSGYEADTAADGPRGMDLLGSKSYDLVLLDLHMPGMDGIAVTEWIRETHPEIPVIVMTGHATVESSIRALRLGAYDYIQKPFTLDEIERTIGNCIEKQRLQKRNTELTQLNERLREIERIKDDLLATVSHEFRTPLTAIHGFLALLETANTTNLTAHQRQCLDAIWDNVNRLDAMIANLLVLVESQDRSYPPILEITSLGQFFEEYQLLRTQCRLRTDYTLELDAASAAHSVLLDRRRFPLVLNNLLDNAFKFCREPDVAQALVRVKKEKDHVWIEVSDAGIGIPDPLADRVFERFTQIDMTSTREFQGAGLGLAVVNTIVASHNGTVKIVPPVLGGTSIRITLPIPPRVGSR